MAFDVDPKMEYWAAQADDLRLTRSIWSRIQDFYNRINNHIYYRRGLESYRTYYGFPTVRDPFDASELAMGGENGEQAAIKVNHYHSIGKALISLTANREPAFQCVALNPDHESLQATRLAQGLLEYYLREKNLESIIRQAIEAAVVLGDGYVLLTWDPSAGRAIAPHPDTGQMMYEGDIKADALTPFDIVLDLDWRSAAERSWVVARTFVDKWALAAQFPEQAEKIIKVTASTEAVSQWPSYWYGGGLAEYRHNRDQVPLFTLYHRKTKAMPNGAMVQLVSGDCMLFRGGLSYGDHLPLHRMSAGLQLGTTQGYTTLWNLLSLQKGIDAAFSTALTNLSLFGVGTLIVPKGSGFNITDLGGGAKALEYDALGGNGKPEPLNVPMTHQDTFKVHDLLVKTSETISGANSTVRGNAAPEASGSRNALDQQMAIEYTSDLQRSYKQLIECVGTGLVRILQTFADTPRQALIVGTGKAWMLKEWKKDDIERVQRVIVKLGNSQADKLQIATDLVQKGLIKSPQEYLQIRETGNLEVMVEGPEAQLIYLKRENEMLRQGIMPKALMGDDDALHIQEHLSILATPEARDNPQILQIVLAHVQAHQQNMGPPMPPAGVPPGPAGPPPPGVPGGGPINPPGPIQNGPLPRLPNMPTNPLTGERAPK